MAVIIYIKRIDKGLGIMPDIKLIALCAAKHEKQWRWEDTYYIDDAKDQALRRKYMADFIREGLIDPNWNKPPCPKATGDISSCDEGCAINGCPDYVDGKADYEPPLPKDE